MERLEQEGDKETCGKGAEDVRKGSDEWRDGQVEAEDLRGRQVDGLRQEAGSSSPGWA